MNASNLKEICETTQNGYDWYELNSGYECVSLIREYPTCIWKQHNKIRYSFVNIPCIEIYYRVVRRFGLETIAGLASTRLYNLFRLVLLYSMIGGKKNRSAYFLSCIQFIWFHCIDKNETFIANNLIDYASNISHFYGVTVNLAFMKCIGWRDY